MKNLEYFFLGIFVLATLGSCSVNSTINESKNSRDTSLDKPDSYLRSSFHINSVNENSAKFSLVSKCTHCDAPDFLLTYSPASQILDIYNIQKEELHSQIDLAALGLASEDGRVSGIHFYKMDSIFIQQDARVTILNQDNILNVIPINDAEENAIFSKYMIANFGSTPLYYNPSDNAIYLSLYSVLAAAIEDDYFNTPITCYYDIGNRTFKEIPVTYPDNYQAEKYGYMIHFSTTFTDEKILYSFHASSQVAVYNFSSGKITYHNMRSSLEDDQLLPFKGDFYNREDVRKHSIESFEYHDIFYDLENKLIYRFAHLGIPEKKEDQFNTYGDKPSILIISDIDFNVLKEVDLGQHKYSTYAGFLYSGGLAISKSHYKNTSHTQGTLSYDVFDFSKLKEK